MVRWVALFIIGPRSATRPTPVSQNSLRFAVADARNLPLDFSAMDDWVSGVQRPTLEVSDLGDRCDAEKNFLDARI
jgi:hypothetical protein